ncbi:MAG TPA: hypothetical protein VIQ00_06910 [Chitinophagaceae bacterium]|jgi:hypothetical protein
MEKETKSALLEIIKDSAKRDFGEAIVNVSLFIPCEAVERDEHLIPTVLNENFQIICQKQ